MTAAPLLIASLPQARHGTMRGEIDLGGILDQEHHCLVCHVGTGLLEVGVHQRLKGHIGSTQQPVQ
ncbi:MAG: hypothetical protein ACLQUY_23245 [Ktedonobacterales bacterium]